MGENIEDFLRMHPYFNVWFQSAMARPPQGEWFGIYTDSDDETHGLAMRYFNKLIVIGEHTAGFSAYLNGISSINGEINAVSGIAGKIGRDVRVLNYCILDNMAPAGVRHTVRRADIAEAEDIVVFYDGGSFPQMLPEVRYTIENNRWYVAEDDGKIVSAACTFAETEEYAIIGVVYTPERSRGRGYATSLMAGLCTDLLSEGKKPLLYYDNPAAGRIYTKIGFKPIAKWGMIKLEG